MMTFEEFLDEQYDEIDNDSNNMNEAFEGRRNSWYENLDIQEVINYGEKYGKYVAYETISTIQYELTVKTLKAHDEFKKSNDNF